MKTHQNNLFYLCLTLFVLVLPSQAHGRIKCWTNSEGVRECGNTIPPEYAQKSHEEVSEQGVSAPCSGVGACATPE